MLVCKAFSVHIYTYCSFLRYYRRMHLNSIGRKYAPISEMCLIPNDIPRIGSALQFELIIAFFHSVGSKMAEFLEEDCSV